MSSPIWSKVILIGDSITQGSFDVYNGCWGSMLAQSLQRVSDVLSRGFSGYTTREIVKIINELITDDDCEKAACVIILLGSNDCAVSPSSQHVPIEQTKKNLNSIIECLKSRGISNKKILLLTPPVYHHEDCVKANEGAGLVPSMRVPDEYSVGVKKVASELEVECIDINKITKDHPNSRGLFYDGLHPNRNGAQVIYDAIWPLLVDRIIAFHGQFELKFPSWEVIEKPDTN